VIPKDRGWRDGLGKYRIDVRQKGIRYHHRTMDRDAVNYVICVRQQNSLITKAIGKRRMVFPAHAVIDGQVRCNLPVILPKHGVVGRVGV
jgi:hypothetical protein